MNTNTVIQPTDDDNLPDINGQGKDNIMPLNEFVATFGDSLIDAVNQQNPPIFDPENIHPYRDLTMDGLLRTPFPSQREAVHAVSAAFWDNGIKAVILNAEMGTGKVRRIGA